MILKNEKKLPTTIRLNNEDVIEDLQNENMNEEDEKLVREKLPKKYESIGIEVLKETAKMTVLINPNSIIEGAVRTP